MRKILVIVFVVLAAGAGFWIYQREMRLKPREAGSPKSGSSPYAGWRTYSSEALQFSFSYPPDWSVSEIEGGVVALLPPTVHFADDAPVSIDVKGEVPYLRALEEIRSDVSNPVETAVRIGGLAGVEISGRLKAGLDSGSGRYSIFTMLNKNGRLVSVDYTEFGADYREVYRAIADSLQFSDVVNTRYFRSD